MSHSAKSAISVEQSVMHATGPHNPIATEIALRMGHQENCSLSRRPIHGEERAYVIILRCGSYQVLEPPGERDSQKSAGSLVVVVVVKSSATISAMALVLPECYGPKICVSWSLVSNNNNFRFR